MKKTFAMMLCILVPMAAAFAAPDATVTFYSTGSLFHAALKAGATLGYPGKAPFTGFVFDGDRRLGLMQPGRFMTLHLPPGPHTFAPATMRSTKRHSEKTQLPVTLEPGKQYFVRLNQTIRGFYVVQIPIQHFEQVDCETAREEASGTEPIKAKRVEKDVRGSLENVAYFPSCK